MNSLEIKANRVDCLRRIIQPSLIRVVDGRIDSIVDLKGMSPDPSLPFACPGFIDAHVHIESSMLVPSEFARLAVVHGTVGTISDPHEIANVNGMEGVRFMIENGKQVPFKFNFGAPSCVPATEFETAGDVLNSDKVDELLASPDILYLSEMMNFPGAIAGDSEVLKKIESARSRGLPVDGHAPGLTGEGLKIYINRGISTDHECFTIEEAREKLSLGMKVIIREGSAAKNFEALIPLVDEYADQLMFCSDDKHPDSLVEGHINQLCARAVAKGYDVFQLLQAACINPVKHYNLQIGLMNVGDPADFILLNNLKDFNVIATYIDGQLVAEQGHSLIQTNHIEIPNINKFVIDAIDSQDLLMPAHPEYNHPVIGCIDGQLITEKLQMTPKRVNEYWESDVERDVLKIVVVNRYTKAPIAKSFIHRFGLKSGAIASSVAHDSHNIVAVGVDDESLCRAINLVIAQKGGISCVGNNRASVLGLPIAGLMSAADGYRVAAEYTAIDLHAKELGSTLGSPFMSLSFMALLVIPHVKLSDKGLFDGNRFSFYS
ncbi:MAG: adenine deaminase [Chitinophagaceae bacterium]|jgi:adenine deaminase